jgi:hypothetical protein
MCLQVHLAVTSLSSSIPVWKIYLFQFFTVLSYINSAVNPFLYAFTNEAFKTSFAAACGCTRSMSISMAAASNNQKVTANTGSRLRRPGAGGRRSVTAGAAGCVDDGSLTVVTRAIVTNHGQLHHGSIGVCAKEDLDTADGRLALAQMNSAAEANGLLDHCDTGGVHSGLERPPVDYSTDCL